MPEMPGVEVLQRLRRAHPYVPVVILTEHNDLGTARQTLASGAFDYIAKPFELTVLERVVGAALGHHRASND